MCPNTLSLVSFAGMTLDKCSVLRMSPVQGKSPLVQLREAYCNLDRVSCRLSFCSVESTPADNACEGVRQYIGKMSGHQAVYREKKGSFNAVSWKTDLLL